MKIENRQLGLTLIEMTVAIAVIALLVSLALPAIRTFFDSFYSEDSTKTMISAALASARATAAKEHRYVGIRFQEAYRPEEPLNAAQYMVFIIHDPTLIDAESVASPYYEYEVNGFRAIDGIKPIKLPEVVGVAELVNDIVEISDAVGIIEKTTFSVVFSPTGKLVIHFAPVLRKDPNDTVFNDPLNNPMFRDDYDDEWPYWQESSRNRFVIYSKNRFDELDTAGKFDYLCSLEAIYINPYMGTIISTNQ